MSPGSLSRLLIIVSGLFSSSLYPFSIVLLVFIKVDNKKRDEGKYDHYLETTSSPELLGNNHPAFRWRS